MCLCRTAGLSFTTFKYSALTADESVAPCDSVGLQVSLTNAGAVTSDEVVQVYVVTPEATVPTPKIRLAAFARVRELQPGQSRVVKLTIRPEACD